MVFKWKIVRPPFHQASAGVEVMHPGMEVEFETGSIGEAHGIFQDSGSALGEMFGAEVIGRAVDTATRIEAPGSNTLPVVETEKERKARERKDKKNGIDPSTAVAPAPITIPGAEAPPTAPAAPADNGIPAFLDRNAAPAAVAPPPPPPAPPAAPVAPAAPPTGVLAGKISAELERRAVGAPDGGQALADWLATSGITVKGATFPEAVTVLRLQADEKLGPIAQALGVA